MAGAMAGHFPEEAEIGAGDVSEIPRMHEDPSEINEVWERVLEGDRMPADEAIDDVDKPSWTGTTIGT